jgi:hypothetical protein
MTNLNPHVSVDCVVFGFDSKKINVLLIEKGNADNEAFNSHKLKLPGNLILENEDLDASAYRTLKDLTGLDNIFLKQFYVFGSPARLTPEEDLNWLRFTTGTSVDRVVTIAYYSLIRLYESNITVKTIWLPVDELPELVFDHNLIVKKALEILQKEVRTEPVCFELLPKFFTIRELQNIYEAILGERLDNRNFRKKILPLKFLVNLNEKEKSVSHKPAKLYQFDKKLYSKHRKEINSFNL